jgi:serine/threonine protein kinase
MARAEDGERGELLLGETLGPYRLEEILGEGQMGIVYRAARDPAGTPVALKLLRAELSADPVYRRRFTREGEIASGLDHPHLVRVLDVGEIEGRHFIAAEYVPGSSLAERIAHTGQLAPSELVRLVTHLGSALDALHRLGLVHRDVKPSNVMVDEDGAGALTDFGLARGDAHTVLTKQGLVVGTIDYLAPEIIRGERATAASDIYALGCVAYECMAGSPPFAHKSFAEACLAHLREEPPNPRRGRSDVNEQLVVSLLTALAKDPARRPATGTAYARLLRASAPSL